VNRELELIDLTLNPPITILPTNKCRRGQYALSWWN